MKQTANPNSDSEARLSSPSRFGLENSSSRVSKTKSFKSESAFAWESLPPGKTTAFQCDWYLGLSLEARTSCSLPKCFWLLYLGCSGTMPAPSQGKPGALHKSVRSLDQMQSTTASAQTKKSDLGGCSAVARMSGIALEFRWVSCIRFGERLGDLRTQLPRIGRVLPKTARCPGSGYCVRLALE